MSMTVVVPVSDVEIAGNGRHCLFFAQTVQDNYSF